MRSEVMQAYTDQILQGDCLELFRQIPDNSVDMTFADPPFNLKKKYHSTKDSLELEEYLGWCEKWISEMVRVTKETGCIFVHNIPKWLTEYASVLNRLAEFRHWISWDAPTAPMGKTLQPSHYGILFYARDAKQHKFYEVRYPHKRCRKCGVLHKDYGGKKAILHPFGPLVSDTWTDIHRIRHNKYRDEHPCQLPIHLLERVILMSTDATDIVLDPFLGTGTTAIAAKRLGRHYIGFELDETYATIAREKVGSESANSKIGDVWVSFHLKEVVTIRDRDWGALSENFYTPESPSAIDRTKIVLKNQRSGSPFVKRKQSEGQDAQLQLLEHAGNTNEEEFYANCST